MQSNLITVRKRESTVDHGPQRARLGGATAVGHDESHTGRKVFRVSSRGGTYGTRIPAGRCRRTVNARAVGIRFLLRPVTPGRWIRERSHRVLAAKPTALFPGPDARAYRNR